MEGYFQNLYASYCGELDGNLQELIQPSISAEENQCLCALPNIEEKKNAVFQLGAHIALGPDGFSTLFS